MIARLSSSAPAVSTARHADRILVMAPGGYYADLYNTYVRHQSLAYVEQFKEIVTV